MPPDTAPSRPTTTILFRRHGEAAPKPDVPCYWLASRSGLFLGRRTEFFDSLAPARTWPRELGSQAPELDLRYPRITAGMLRRIIGFFGIIAERDRAEACVLLAWDIAAKRLGLHVPPQVAIVNVNRWGDRSPVSVRYDVPTLPGIQILGSVHSHVYLNAYSSNVDEDDEQFRAGLHVVVGALDLEPPQLHAVFVVDGHRFPVDPSDVLDLANYGRRDISVPREWIERVRVETTGAASYQQHQKPPANPPAPARAIEVGAAPTSMPRKPPIPGIDHLFFEPVPLPAIPAAPALPPSPALTPAPTPEAANHNNGTRSSAS